MGDRWTYLELAFALFSVCEATRQARKYAESLQRYGVSDDVIQAALNKAAKQ